MLESNRIYLGDCLEVMKDIDDKSIDMILCDLPYGVLNKKNKGASWDNIIPFISLWKQYERIIKDNGAIVLAANGMFTADLMRSNVKLWRYNLIWDKVLPTGFLNANKMPLRSHEDICVFYKKLPVYNPQMEKVGWHKKNHSRKITGQDFNNNCYGNFKMLPVVMSDEKYPKSIITISKEHCNGNFLHPTQKPVALFEYLIKTYTNENDLVLDNCSGSGTTAIACYNTKRKFICIEKEEKYYNLSMERYWYHVIKSRSEGGKNS